MFHRYLEYPFLTVVFLFHSFMGPTVHVLIRFWGEQKVLVIFCRFPWIGGFLLHINDIFSCSTEYPSSSSLGPKQSCNLSCGDKPCGGNSSHSSYRYSSHSYYRYSFHSSNRYSFNSFYKYSFHSSYRYSSINLHLTGIHPIHLTGIHSIHLTSIHSIHFTSIHSIPLTGIHQLIYI